MGADESTRSAAADGQSDDHEGSLVWFLVDRSEDHAAIEHVARQLETTGVETEVVTITEVIGSAAREAVAGGAERILRGLRVAWQGPSGEEDFLRAIRREQPELLVVTSSRYARPLSLLEGLTGAGSVQVGVPLDFNIDARWLNGSIDAFLAPEDRARETFEKAGYSSEHLFGAGPPVSPNFERELDREAEREQLGFGDETTILVRAESFSPTTLDRIVFQGTLVDDEVRFFFHHNGDGAVSERLRRSADKHGLPAAMFGRVSDLERYVHASDVVVASPAEPLLPEIVRSGRPLFLVGAPEGYMNQIEVLTGEYGAGHVDEVLRFGSQFEQFLADESLTEVDEIIDTSALEPGNDRVVEALGSALDRVEQWRSAPKPGPSGSGEEPSEDEPARPQGPFESIGSGEHGQVDRDKALEVADAGHRPNLSQAEAKDQLAELILKEREMQRRLSELEREQERWRNRLDLAREWGEEDLAEEAKGILREYIDDASRVRDDLEDIRRQKEKLKKAAKRGQGGQGGASERSRGRSGETGDVLDDPERAAELEDRFNDMELDRDLDDLRDRIEGELGD
jgi:hypothetical protein